MKTQIELLEVFSDELFDGYKADNMFSFDTEIFG